MNKRGFTLIETIVYIALLSVLLTGALLSTSYLIDGSERGKKLLSAQEEATFVLRKLNFELGSAQSASSPNPTTLELSPGDIVIKEDDGRMMISRSGGGAVPLTAERNVVSGTQFSVVRSPGRADVVELHFMVDGRKYSFKRSLRGYTI